jgi:hypothetical protein
MAIHAVDPLSADVGYELGEAAVCRAAEFAVGEFGGPAFHQVEQEDWERCLKVCTLAHDMHATQHHTMCRGY